MENYASKPRPDDNRMRPPFVGDLPVGAHVSGALTWTAKPPLSGI